MNGTLGSTSMARFSGFGLSGFSLCSTLFDVGELRRRNTEEHPWLRVSAVSPPKVRAYWCTGGDGSTGLDGQSLDTDLEGSCKFSI